MEKNAVRNQRRLGTSTIQCLFTASISSPEIAIFLWVMVVGLLLHHTDSICIHLPNGQTSNSRWKVWFPKHGNYLAWTRLGAGDPCKSLTTGLLMKCSLWARFWLKDFWSLVITGFVDRWGGCEVRWQGTEAHYYVLRYFNFHIFFIKKDKPDGFQAFPIS